MCVDLMSQEIFSPEKELIVCSSVFPDTEHMATSMTKRRVICLLGLLVITFILPVFWRQQGALTPWSHRHRSRDFILFEKLAVHDIKRFPLVPRSSRPNAVFIMQNYIATLC
ncbi:hypothetical protein OUZ56_019573 [Daphnia magna]|uniref:Uncharacterized protein n=1 Tax=Daphnia magna TaxID=35525 RepID=A0ABQ9ZBY9_9CRUS|nr:hypothetical protein OUZ56_019573 [Daphnia magna]